MDGETLKSERIALGLTQAELAAILGTTVTTVARWETGQRAVNEGWARLALAEAGRRRVKPKAPGRRGPRKASQQAP